MFNSFINNIALLLALSICHILILKRWKPDTKRYQIVSGVLFGLIIIAGMMNPFVLTKGIIFDGRSLVISVAGLVCGPVAAFIAAVIGSIYRVWGVGGGGSLTGVLVLSSSAILGSVYHFISRKNPNYLKNPWLYVFGLIVHVAMVLLMFTLPSDQIWKAISTISLPVLILFPIGTMILGRFLLDQIEAAELHESLKVSEEKYRELVESANSIILRINKEGCITYFNDYAQALFGYSENEAIRQPIVGFLIPGDDGFAPAYVNQIFKNPDDYQMTETEGILKNGERIWISWTNKVIHDDAGLPNEVFSIGSNITQRKIADNKLRESNKYIQEIIKNAHEGIIVYDNELRIIVWNEFMERFTEISAAKVLGLKPVEVFPVLNDTDLMGNLERALKGEPAASIEIPIPILESGKKRWALDTSGPLR
ncbi:PAS domain S-box protein, partial [bacterium]|nr:PAS domain S-box protein [bacterium]